MPSPYQESKETVGRGSSQQLQEAFFFKLPGYRSEPFLNYLPRPLEPQSAGSLLDDLFGRPAEHKAAGEQHCRG